MRMWRKECIRRWNNGVTLKESTEKKTYFTYYSWISPGWAELKGGHPKCNTKRNTKLKLNKKKIKMFMAVFSRMRSLSKKRSSSSIACDDDNNETTLIRL